MLEEEREDDFQESSDSFVYLNDCLVSCITLMGRMMSLRRIVIKWPGWIGREALGRISRILRHRELARRKLTGRRETVRMRCMMLRMVAMTSVRIWVVAMASTRLWMMAMVATMVRTCVAMTSVLLTT
jgi:hypothetical protein